ncbi:hypothetical protein [Desulfoluna sp.]|uniref:hypothetical protein n=1 Tax=Desulfoluna sp. TaxID=2045199 RepID=UPI00261785AB|nr:hypothetical protein [Desulfoluna sp.]
MKFRVYLLIVLMLHGFANPCLSRDDLDMDNLFSNDGFIIQIDDLENESVMSIINGRSVNFSGSLYNKSRYTTKRSDYTLKTIFVDYVSQLPESFREQNQADIDKFKETYHIGDDDWFTSTMTANLLFDIRLVDNVRGFMNLDAIYYPYGFSEYHLARDENQKILEIEEEKDTDLILKEIFIDANINKKVFLRGGKQVLQWGRGFFFNPTDLINIEKKRFLDMDANREGTYGLKAHVPFGIKYNVYGFIDLGTEEDTDYFAYAGKFEFLLDKTEISLSSWKKKGVDPIFGFDISTRWENIDILGELSLTSKETVLRPNNDFTVTETEDRWVPRYSLALMTSFDFMDINDRITLGSELYYNHAGYSENIFDDPAKVLTLFANDLYTMHNHSVYYAMFFAEYKEFFINDLTFCLSGLGNYTDKSGIGMAQLKYTPLYDFTLECSLSSTFGDDGAEFTFTGDEVSIEVVAKILF